ncbi:MAG: hypothetical protein WBX05_09025 [Pseudolabrys sp.]
MATRPMKKPDAKEADKFERAKHLVDRAAWHEEIRFAKRQLWGVAAAGLALLGGLLAALPSLRPFRLYEKWVGALVVLLIWGGCFYFLRSLRGHLVQVRKEFGEESESASKRGLDILWLFVGALTIGALIVGYALFRDSTAPTMWLAPD